MSSRRATLTTAVSGLSGLLIGCLSGNDKLQNQLDTVREATTQYTNHKQALQDGFKPAGPFVPGMGWHFSHPQRVEEAAKNGFSLESPQALVYDAKMNLGAVEWAAPNEAITPSPDLFADENADVTENWHPKKPATHVLAVPYGEQTRPKEIPPSDLLTNSNWAGFHPPNPDLKPGDSVKLHWGSLNAKQSSPKEERIADLVQTIPELTTLHAWVYTENPHGVFSPMNPDFAQSHGHSDNHH